MTGTPLDLTPFGPLLSAIGLLYWAIALGAAGLALWWPPSWFMKLPLAAMLLTGFVYPVLRHDQEKRARIDTSTERLEASTALFNERCKAAGENAKCVFAVRGTDLPAFLRTSRFVGLSTRRGLRESPHA